VSSCGSLCSTSKADQSSRRSITSDGPVAPAPLPSHLRPRTGCDSSPVVAMDISPAPHPLATSTLADEDDTVRGGVFGSSSSSSSSTVARPPLFSRPHSQPLAPSSSSRPSSTQEHPFLKSLFRAQQSAPPTQTTFAPIVPLSLPRSESPEELPLPPIASTSAAPHRPTLPHYATAPPTQADKLRGTFESSSFLFGRGSDVAIPSSRDGKGKATAPLRLPGATYVQLTEIACIYPASTKADLFLPFQSIS
jgi:hypothetical protein